MCKTSFFQHMARRFLVTGVVLVLLACEGNNDMFREFRLKRLSPGIATEQEVRDIMGQPAQSWMQPDGSQTLVYPMGPMGVHTWMVTTGNGMVRKIDQVLTQDTFDKVLPGMTTDEVTRLLGKPRRIVPFEGSGQVVWDWRFRDALGEHFFNVHFEATSQRVKTTSYTDEIRN